MCNLAKFSFCSENGINETKLTQRNEASQFSNNSCYKQLLTVNLAVKRLMIHSCWFDHLSPATAFRWMNSYRSLCQIYVHKSFDLWAEFAYKLTRAYTIDVKRYSFRWARKVLWRFLPCLVICFTCYPARLLFSYVFST